MFSRARLVLAVANKPLLKLSLSNVKFSHQNVRHFGIMGSIGDSLTKVATNKMTGDSGMVCSSNQNADFLLIATHCQQ